MSETLRIGGHAGGFAATARTDRWWVGPLLTFAGLGAFVVYSTWAAFQGAYYYAAPYLSPFYSPLLFIDPSAPGAAPLEHAWIGAWPSWWPALLPASPAFLILIFPGAFRATCYYYRKAYYRSFFATPPGCAVGPIPQGRYKGETSLLIFQNLHRYALYFAILFIFILYLDAFKAFFKDGRLGVGVGTLVLLINPTLLGLYTFGCHSFRHLVGGGLDCFSCDRASAARHGLWKKVTALNERHMLWAWTSLFWVGFTDVYVRLVAMGVIRDLNTWG
ncbi:MAG: hypothetical protein DMF50_13605 [Acidobacteria bacterium]|nr:MAG: hypothetical protein DMF50_13605 [Acidobacteriota bacterium]